LSLVELTRVADGTLPAMAAKIVPEKAEKKYG